MRKADIKAKARRASILAKRRAQVQKVLETHFSVFEPETCKGVQIFDSQCRGASVSSEFAKDMSGISTKWSISLYILCREKNGKRKVVTEVLDIDTPCKHVEIAELCADYQIEFCEAFEHQDIILTTAWIATAKGCEPTEEQAYIMFEKLGSFDLKANWELASE